MHDSAGYTDTLHAGHLGAAGGADQPMILTKLELQPIMSKSKVDHENHVVELHSIMSKSKVDHENHEDVEVDGDVGPPDYTVIQNPIL